VKRRRESPAGSCDAGAAGRRRGSAQGRRCRAPPMGELAAECSRGDGGGCARAGDVPDVESGRGGGRCVHRALTQQGDRTERQRGSAVGRGPAEGAASWAKGVGQLVARRTGREGAAASWQVAARRRPGASAAASGQRAARRRPGSGRRGDDLARSRLRPARGWRARRRPGVASGCRGSRRLGEQGGREGRRGEAGGWGPAAAAGGRKPLAAVAVCGEDLNLI
jgi:hypothetical protein